MISCRIWATAGLHLKAHQEDRFNLVGHVEGTVGVAASEFWAASGALIIKFQMVAVPSVSFCQL